VWGNNHDGGPEGAVGARSRGRCRGLFAWWGMERELVCVPCAPCRRPMEACASGRPPIASALAGSECVLWSLSQARDGVVWLLSSRPLLPCRTLETAESATPVGGTRGDLRDVSRHSLPYPLRFGTVVDANRADGFLLPNAHHSGAPAAEA
jgi:hypothetical protein